MALDIIRCLSKEALFLGFKKLPILSQSNKQFGILKYFKYLIFFWNLSQEPEEINPEDELEDTCENKEDDLGAVEEQRSVILHLLSQLKLGMDLTRVSY